MDIQNLYENYRKSGKVSTDTRQITSGSIFFALKGEKFNANAFAGEALAKGASYAVIDEAQYAADNRYLVVADVLGTLQELARYHRQQLFVPVIGLTGSNGKTTSKELLHAVLTKKFKTFATKGNLNNHIGVPLTLLNINDKHEIAVIEMGASARGEIMDLCKIARPTHGLITSIGKAHLEGFGSVENIIKTKTELYEYLRDENGLFFYNLAVKEIHDVLKNKNFERAEKFDNENFGGKNIDSIESSTDKMFIQLKIKQNDGVSKSFSTSVYGQYNFNNIVNACKLADYFDVGTEKIIKALREFIPSNNRSQLIEWKNNTVTH
ncbi:MAG: UDP-N-acetylmuramoyl-tripeptide--D-alanyl-D-alanine ligase [Chitinophagaceae bacterium]|nr:UDP-N-acetylmuramoyl-tripeptide--D-alanyl-D-alanine ligase [Chitinophagaceae bacterium]